MTEKEKYEVLLGELAEKLKEKNDTISLQSWQIEELKKKLTEAETHIPKVKQIEIR